MAGLTRSRGGTGRASLVLGVLLVVAPLLLAALSWDVVVAGHPAYGLALLVMVLLGVAALVARRPRSIAGLVAAGVVGALVFGGLVWARPYGPSPEAQAAMVAGGPVSVRETATSITLTPASARVGLVFQPGARVDARAYVPLLRRVAESGVLVVVVKQPYGIGFLSVASPDAVRSAHPEVTSWAVGGHSLGGVAAAEYVRGHPETSLVLWASYPASSIADSPARVLSVSASNDGLSTPAKVAAARPLLPPSAQSVVVSGGVHAFFGDYGPQAGDGTPSVTREVAQADIVRATVGFLGQL